MGVLSAFNVTCIVMEIIGGLSQQPIATWLSHDESVISSNDGILTSSTDLASSTIAELRFPSLQWTHTLDFICTGSIVSLGDTFTVRNTFSVVVLRKLSIGYTPRARSLSDLFE
jgi:hypothetical protein